MISLKLLVSSALIVLLSAQYYSTYSQDQGSLYITQGIAAGDVTSSSVIIWSRASMPSFMHVEYDIDYKFSNSKSKLIQVTQSSDLTGHIKLDDLKPNALHYYRVWFSAYTKEGTLIDSNSQLGTFKTAPKHWMDTPVSFIFGGDLGGQQYCRRVPFDYSIFSIIKDLAPNFFIFIGDQIYADDYCPAQAPSGVIGWKNVVGDFPSIKWPTVNWSDVDELHNIYLRHWEYNRNDTHFQSFLRNTSMYSQFDDHEVIDSYGATWDHLPGEFKNRIGYHNLVKTGIDLFVNFSPIDITENRSDFYRSFSWGKHLELFLLDTRTYRSSNDIVDIPENKKTMLGKEQLDRLKEGLRTSSATWKIVSSSVPLTISNCVNEEVGCDSWASNGIINKAFANERSQILRFLDVNNITNVVFLVTDVHFPATVKVNKSFDDNKDKLVLHEFVTGPLSAGFPSTNPVKPDPTINATYLYTENKIFSFGYIKIQKDSKDGRAHLIYEVRDENGILRPNSHLNLSPFGG